MPVVFIVLSVLLLIYCGSIPKDDAIFLRLVSIIILLSAVTELFFTLRRSEATVELNGRSILKALVLLAILTVYVILLKIVGFLPMTALLGIATTRYLGYRNWKNNIMISVVVTLAAYVIFSVLLKVPLPMGLLFS